MTFTEDQKRLLNQPLDPRHVAERSQSGQTLSYVEGWHVIAEANRIFGFDGWTRETVDVRQVSQYERKIGRQQKDGWSVTYTARVRVVVGGVAREGCGAGHGIGTDLGECHESALKEAETDAMKRALMTFGNPFGLALYDKSKANVCAPPKELPTGPINDKTRDWISGAIDKRQIPVGELCKAFDVTSLKGLNYEDIDDVKSWIAAYKKEAA